MKRVVYLRADADSEIGYGHFMRTLALAEVLSSSYDCRFATKSPSEFQRTCLKNVCKLIELPSDERRFEAFLNIIEGGNIVVLDNYFYDQEYECKLRNKGAKVVLIDNLHARHSCADVILGFALGLKCSDYSVEAYTKLYLGAAYSLIRKPFIEQLAVRHMPANFFQLKVVISLGGADHKGVASSIADILAELDNVKSILVIGNSSKDITHNDKVTFKIGLTAEEMRDAFIQNDIAVLSASTTLFEAMACGIPIIGGYHVNNQIVNYNNIIAGSGIIGCGDLQDDNNRLMVRELLCDRAFIESYHPHSVIPNNLENNILSIFEEL